MLAIPDQFSPNVIAALNKLQDSGGAIHWQDGSTPPAITGCEDAIALGLVQRHYGSGWDAMEGVMLTEKGWQVLGVRPPSMLDRLIRFFKPAGFAHEA